MKQSNRYIALAIVCILALCALLFMYIHSVKQSEDVAKANQAVQAQVTIDSNVCKVYPDQELCILARKVAENPDEKLTPKDGQDGKDGTNGTNGSNGRGISSLTIATGSLIVSYTDGQTQDLGTVVGRDGAPGATGETGATGEAGTNGKDGTDGINGRGITSTDIVSGNLIVTYSDGTTQNAGMVVGPKGDTGAAGLNGTNGQDGEDGQDGQDGAPGATGPSGLTPTAVNTDINGYVTITYSDGSKAQAGRVLLPTVELFQCTDGQLTLKMSNGVAQTIPADCSPDELPLGLAKQ